MRPGVDDDAVYVGTGGGTVLSLSRDGGTERWSYDAGGGAGSTPPLVTDEAVVLGIE
jgi:outer membrane protein assembly factor BamB